MVKKKSRWKCPVCKGSLGSDEPQKKDIVTVWCTKCNFNYTYPIKASTETEALDLFYETYKREEEGCLN